MRLFLPSEFCPSQSRRERKGVGARKRVKGGPLPAVVSGNSPKEEKAASWKISVDGHVCGQESLAQCKKII